MPDYALLGQKWGTSSTFGTAGGLVSWAVDATVPAYVVNLISLAFASWSQYGNIQFQQVASVNQSLIDISFGAIDGASNILGEASYSFSGQRITSANIEFDVAENWHQSGQSVVSSSGASFYVVALHEIGHAIGLDHYDVSLAVMNAFIDPSVTDVRTSDINGVVAIYGPVGGAQPIFGTAGNDTLAGGNLNDTIYGLGGIDQISGGLGNDSLYGGAADIVDVSTDILFGNDGNDLLDGRQGVDLMYGGLGDDVFIVDNVDDRAFELASQGADTVRVTAQAYQLQDNIEYGVLEGAGALLVGNAGNNWLGGTSGANTIFGGAGHDTIVAGIGADILYGGEGSDSFYFGNIADAGDNIRDFSIGVDRIILQGSAFLLPGPLSQGGSFVAAAGMPGPALLSSSLLYSITTGNLFWDPDGSGTNGAVFVANFAGNPLLAASDFLVA